MCECSVLAKRTTVCDYFAQSEHSRAFFRIFVGRPILFCFFSFAVFFSHREPRSAAQSTLRIWMSHMEFLFILLIFIVPRKMTAAAAAPNAKYDSYWARILRLDVRYATPDPAQNTNNLFPLLCSIDGGHGISRQRLETFRRPCEAAIFAQLAGAQGDNIKSAEMHAFA